MSAKYKKVLRKPKRFNKKEAKSGKIVELIVEYVEYFHTRPDTSYGFERTNEILYDISEVVDYVSALLPTAAIIFHEFYLVSPIFYSVPVYALA